MRSVLAIIGIMFLAASGSACTVQNRRASDNPWRGQYRPYTPASPSTDVESFGAWMDRNYPQLAGRIGPRDLLHEFHRQYLREQEARRRYAEERRAEEEMQLRREQLQLQREQLELERERLNRLKAAERDRSSGEDDTP